MSNVMDRADAVNRVYKTISVRGQEWLDFAAQVLNHIEDYTVPQYGDKGSDNVSKKDSKFCIDQVEKYCARFGKNSRENQEELDLIKIAHYAALAWGKMIDTPE